RRGGRGARVRGVGRVLGQIRAGRIAEPVHGNLPVAVGHPQPAPCRPVQPRRAPLERSYRRMRLLLAQLMNMIPTIVFIKTSGAGTANDETSHAWAGARDWAIM